MARASLYINSSLSTQIGKGLVVFVGVSRDDTNDDIEFVVNKTISLRIFSDDIGKFNFSCQEVAGEILLVSQFTLFADVRKGNRPSFLSAAPPEMAKTIFEQTVERFIDTGLAIQTGVFQQHMTIDLSNDGPVSLLIDSTIRHLSRRKTV